MALTGFAGRVFIVAGDGPAFEQLAVALTDAGALVAMIATGTGADDIAACFRANPADRLVWDRVVPHTEQRLGPIDGVVADRAAAPIATELVGPDLARRGHGAVVCVDVDASADDVLRTLAGTL